MDPKGPQVNRNQRQIVWNPPLSPLHAMRGKQRLEEMSFVYTFLGGICEERRVPKVPLLSSSLNRNQSWCGVVWCVIYWRHCHVFFLFYSAPTKKRSPRWSTAVIIVVVSAKPRMPLIIAVTSWVRIYKRSFSLLKLNQLPRASNIA